MKAKLFADFFSASGTSDYVVLSIYSDGLILYLACGAQAQDQIFKMLKEKVKCELIESARSQDDVIGAIVLQGFPENSSDPKLKSLVAIVESSSPVSNLEAFKAGNLIKNFLEDELESSLDYSDCQFRDANTIDSYHQLLSEINPDLIKELGRF